MQQYDLKILNALLDSYENSLLSRGENKISVHIEFPFTKKKIPQYFDESSLAFEEIHAALKELEHKGYLSVIWKKGKKNHIIQKVVLNEKKTEDVYAYVCRIPKADMAMRQDRLIQQLKKQHTSPIAVRLLEYLSRRIHKGESVKEFIDLSNVEETRELVGAIAAIERNDKECYIREFSVWQFGDSKRLENLLGIVGKVMHRFEARYAQMDVYAILAEYKIYHTPNYVYVKGSGQLVIGDGQKNRIDLADMNQGIGLSGDDLENLGWEEISNIKKVITIENLTTFFRWKEENSILIYLGGYHNSVRRRLLRRLYEQAPDADYLHFGDIDVGGMEIYEDLCTKTQIPFQLYHMGVEELQKYKQYARVLTENDKKRLDKLLEKEPGEQERKVLEYMKEHQVKLEQECIQV